MTTKTNIEAVNSGQTEREAFKEFRAALCRMNGANTPVSVADRVMILSNATFLLDEYERAASPAPASPSGEPGMTNGDFHCPACGSVLKGPTACGSCLWERDTCGYALAASPSGEDAAEQADEAVTSPEPFKSPLTSFGLLVRALRIVAGTTLYDMAKALSSTPATLSAVECGRKPLTEEMVIDTYVFFAKLGVLDTLHALNAARAKDSK